MKKWFVLLVALALLAGCNEDDRVLVPARDVTPPAAPRGVYSVTGSGEVFLYWDDNTETDVVGYRVYESPCVGGPTCPYDLVGTTSGTSFTISGLTNGVTRYFAVSAYDRAGNESILSKQDIFDTPRPEGFGRALTNSTDGPGTAGYDFSAFSVRPFDDSRTDIYFSAVGAALKMVAPFTDTDIQDAGYGSSLDAVDFAPSTGWSPSGTAELIVGHCYVVRITTTTANFYAKFRVTALTPDEVTFDWAYQTDPNNRELKSGRSRDAGVIRVRRVVS